MEEDRISEKTIGYVIDAHKSLGPGLLEYDNKECLFYELKQTGLTIEKQVALPLIYKEVKLNK